MWFEINFKIHVECEPSAAISLTKGTVDIMNVKKGDKVIFKGYEEAPEEGADLLVEGQEYEVVSVNKDDNSVSVEVENPDFNPKKKESEKNARTILTDIFFEELEEVEGKAKAPSKAKGSKGKAKAEEPEDEPEDEEEDDEDDEEEEPEEEPARKSKAKAKAKAPAKGKKAKEEQDEEEQDEEDDHDEEEEPEEEPVKKAKGKAKAKAAPKAKAKSKAAPKGKSKLKGKAPKEAAEEIDPYGDLDEEQEDQEILGLVNDAEDILDLARETVEESSALEYKLGGVLYHVRKTAVYQNLDERYAEKGGFSLYLLEHLNTE